ncbi:hypothetical protein [Polaribacter sp. Z022]|uniref:hypothetical protein n=1 Tax=Polaribacter sp. Z022 TaxID=2927125 RepID=UPI0020222367|nr:hypothetical protein [Polaribacter sp. Z022]MCL7753939.1 hypothetical protein [Polaribacter sp. Z022]
MKKIVLTVLAIGTLVFTSCKSEKKEVKDITKDVEKVVVETKKEVVEETKEVVEEVKKGLTSALEGITIPSFSNEAVSKNLLEYSQYAKNYIDAKGNLAKITGMASKGASLLKQGKELASKLDASELTKYKSVLSQIQAKMAPSK